MSMDYEATIRWLSRRVRVLSAQRMLGGFLMLLGGAALLVATWGLCYVVSLFALGGWIGHQHWFHSVLGLFVIPILFTLVVQVGLKRRATDDFRRLTL